jgi:hypothetical protein
MKNYSSSSAEDTDLPPAGEDLDPVDRSRIFREARAAERERYQEILAELREEHRRARQRLQAEVDRENRQKREALDQVARLKSEMNDDRLEISEKHQAKVDQLRDRIHQLEIELRIKEVESKFVGGERSLADTLLEMAEHVDLGQLGGQIAALARQMKNGRPPTAAGQPHIQAGAAPAAAPPEVRQNPSEQPSMNAPSDLATDETSSARKNFIEGVLRLVLSGLSSGQVQRAAKGIEEQVQTLKAQGLEPRRKDWGIILREAARQALEAGATPANLAQVIRPILGRYDEQISGFLNTNPTVARKFLEGFLELSGLSDEIKQWLNETIEHLQRQSEAQTNGAVRVDIDERDTTE